MIQILDVINIVLLYLLYLNELLLTTESNFKSLKLLTLISKKKSKNVTKKTQIIFTINHH